MTFPDYDLIISDLFIDALDGLFLCDITEALGAWRLAGRPSRYRRTLSYGAVVNAQDGCISIEVGGSSGVLAVLSLIDFEIDVFRVHRDRMPGESKWRTGGRWTNVLSNRILFSAPPTTTKESQ